MWKTDLTKPLELRVGELETGVIGVGLAENVTAW
jgi:hypothetical protein